MTKHLTTILKKQCNIVGVNFDDIDFSKSGWYQSHVWTEQQEQEFSDWLYNYFLENKEAREELLEHKAKDKKYIKRAISEFNLNYGWKTKHGDQKK